MFKFTPNRLLNYKFRSKFFYKKKSSITGFSSSEKNKEDNINNNSNNNTKIDNGYLINKRSKNIKFSTQDILSSLPDPTNKNWKSKVWFTIDRDNQLIDELLKEKESDSMFIKTNSTHEENENENENEIQHSLEFEIKANDQEEELRAKVKKREKRKDKENNELNGNAKDEIVNSNNDNFDGNSSVYETSSNEVMIEDEIERMEKELQKLREIKKLKQKEKAKEFNSVNSSNNKINSNNDNSSDNNISLKPTMSVSSNSTTSSNHLKGKNFELKTVEVFNSFGMNLKRTGGRDDKGKDFEGEWVLPGDRTIKIIGQCKNFSNKKVGPSVLREFESTIQRYKVLFDEENQKLIKKDKSSIVGIIASSTGFSHSIKSFTEDIQHPLIICQLTNQGIISFHLNTKAKSVLPNLFIGRRKYNNNNNNNDFNNNNDSFYTLELFYH